MERSIKDKWDSGAIYENYMGRWSKLIAIEFLNWLDMPDSLNWLDIGCGTGALSEAILKNRNPSSLTCMDPSKDFLASTKARINNKGDFLLGSADAIALESRSVDVVVSGLALNFFPDLEKALFEMKRVSKANGTISAYVWDYSGRMDMIRYFWDTVNELDPEAKLDEGIRFPICNPVRLKEAFQKAGLSAVEVSNLDIITRFKNFDDYWNPFLGKVGPAPSYVASLSTNKTEKLRDYLYKKLPFESDGSIQLLGRVIAIQGKS